MTDHSKFTKDIVTERIKRVGFHKKTDIADLVKNSHLSKTVETLATKAELKAEQDKIVKLKYFDPNYFQCKIHFEDDGTQSYLVFQPV